MHKCVFVSGDLIYLLCEVIGDSWGSQRLYSRVLFLQNNITQAELNELLK